MNLRRKADNNPRGLKFVWGLKLTQYASSIWRTWHMDTYSYLLPWNTAHMYSLHETLLLSHLPPHGSLMKLSRRNTSDMQLQAEQTHSLRLAEWCSPTQSFKYQSINIYARGSKRECHSCKMEEVQFHSSRQCAGKHTRKLPTCAFTDTPLSDCGAMIRVKMLVQLRRRSGTSSVLELRCGLLESSPRTRELWWVSEHTAMTSALYILTFSIRHESEVISFRGGDTFPI